MTRMLCIPVVLGIFLAFSGSSDAKGTSGSNGPKAGSSHNSQHNPSQGMNKGSHGPSRTYGRDYHWTSRYWNSRYGCDFCYSSVDSCYFYFYAPAACYYPVSYIALYPPVVVPAPVAVTPVAPLSPTPVAIAPSGGSIQVNNTNINGR